MTLQFDLVLLILLAAFAHAAWHALIKASGEPFLTFTMFRAVGFTGGTIGAFFVPLPDAAAWPYLIASAIAHNAYYLLFLFSYRYGDLSLVYPIARGGAPALVVAAAIPFAGEIPGPLGVLGVALISAGIFAIAFARGIPKGADVTAIALAAGTTVSIVAYTLIDGLGARRSGDAFGYAAWLFILESLPFVVFAAATRARAFVVFAGSEWRRGLGGGFMMLLTYSLIIYAFTQGPLAYVSALRETSILFAALIGAITLKESFGWRRIAAALVIVAGIVLLQLGG
ncbi:MAG: EamA family transporter [Rhodospirillales bacterium]|nr:EamA family transporter [Rhodospirillales bacterium]MSP80143.1 EamA family transporter [Rhodospirillales bacterium]